RTKRDGLCVIDLAVTKLGEVAGDVIPVRASIGGSEYALKGGAALDDDGEMLLESRTDGYGGAAERRGDRVGEDPVVTTAERFDDANSNDRGVLNVGKWGIENQAGGMPRVSHRPCRAAVGGTQDSRRARCDQNLRVVRMINDAIEILGRSAEG